MGLDFNLMTFNQPVHLRINGFDSQNYPIEEGRR